jgi:chaperone BCS1
MDYNLFYGPPGTGKSSLSTAIANYTKRNVFTITPSKDMTDSTLVSLIINRPIDSIVVFEDFDCLLSNISREKVEGDKKENTINISLSCILNILDGTYTPDNCIFIITTNDVEKIDPAIKRKGRTDVLLEIPQHSVSLLDKVRKKYNISDDIIVESVQDIQNLVIKKSIQ